MLERLEDKTRENFERGYKMMESALATKVTNEKGRRSGIIL